MNKMSWYALALFGNMLIGIMMMLFCALLPQLTLIFVFNTGLSCGLLSYHIAVKIDES
jgi:hypothetical protein